MRILNGNKKILIISWLVITFYFIMKKKIKLNFPFATLSVSVRNFPRGSYRHNHREQSPGDAFVCIRCWPVKYPFFWIQFSYFYDYFLSDDWSKFPYYLRSAEAHKIPKRPHEILSQCVSILPTWSSGILLRIFLVVFLRGIRAHQNEIELNFSRSGREVDKAFQNIDFLIRNHSNL